MLYDVDTDLVSPANCRYELPSNFGTTTSIAASEETTLYVIGRYSQTCLFQNEARGQTQKYML